MHTKTTVRVLLAGLLLAAQTTILTAQNNVADPVRKAPIMSRWEKQLTAQNAWREYPRPQMARPKWQNLNGMWDYAITPKTAAPPPNTTDRFWCRFA